MLAEVPVRFETFSFGSLRIDGVTYDHDVVIDRGKVRKRNKKPSKKFREEFGHTPLSLEEEIPWKLSFSDIRRSPSSVFRQANSPQSQCRRHWSASWFWLGWRMDGRTVSPPAKG
jgi:hypothetical protein